MNKPQTAGQNGASTSAPGQMNNVNDFVLYPKYKNTLPEIPFDGKFLMVRKGGLEGLKERFVKYHPTQMEMNMRRSVLSDVNVGVKIDLVDPETYRVDTRKPPVEINEVDQMLLEDESVQSVRKMKRSAQHAAVVPFMRRTEYISSEFNRFGTGADRQETKIGYGTLKGLNPSEVFYNDRESQINAIEKTFEDVKKPALQHHNKPGVTAVEEIPVFPDFENWKYILAEVNYDNDPSFKGLPEELQKLGLSNSVLMGGLDDDGNSIGHFVPSADTLQKYMELDEGEREHDEDEVFEYPLNREYHWDVNTRHQANFEEDFVFYERDGKMHYDALGVKIKLTRRRKPASEPKVEGMLEMTHRDHNDEEVKILEQRMNGLTKPFDKVELDSESEKEQKEASSDESEKNAAEESPKSDSESDRKEEETKPKAKSSSQSSSSSAASNSSSSSSSNDSDTD